MNLAAIFQVLEHLNDIEIIGYGTHFVFQNKAKIFLRQNISRTGLFMVWGSFSWSVFTFLSHSTNNKGEIGHFCVMTPFNLDSQAMTSYKLFSHSEPLGAILWEIQSLFNRMTPFDIKHGAILFSELGQNYYQSSFSSNISFVQI